MTAMRRQMVKALCVAVLIGGLMGWARLHPDWNKAPVPKPKPAVVYETVIERGERIARENGLGPIPTWDPNAPPDPPQLGPHVIINGHDFGPIPTLPPTTVPT